MGTQKRKQAGGGLPRKTIDDALPTVPRSPGGLARRVAPWRPEWRGVYENYAHGWVAKWYWRVRRVCPSREDAVQECAVVYCRCVRRYIDQPELGAKDGYGRVDNPKWFMALYKQAVYFRWIKLQWNDSAHRALESDEHLEDLVAAHLSAGFRQPRIPGHGTSVSYNDGPFHCALAEASPQLQQTIARLLDTPQRVMDCLLGDTTSDTMLAPQARLYINEGLRRWCGVKGPVDIIGELQQLLMS